MTSFYTFIDLIHKSLNLQTIVIALVILVIFYYFWQYHGVPPGPWGIPIIGFWPFIKVKDIHEQLRELREKYGDIYSFTVAGNLCISLNTLKMIREAHITKSECFGDRYDGYGLLTHSFEESVTMSNGDSWRVQRKFFLQKFKEFGMYAIKENFSDSVYDTLKETIEEMRVKNGEAFSMSELLMVKCSSITRRILFNDQGITENELKEINREYEKVLAVQNHKNLLLIGNIPKYLIFPFMPSYWTFLRGHNNIHKMLMKIINRHKENFDANQILDIIDCYYNEKRVREKKGDPTSRYFTDKALLSAVYQFITDGALTTAFFIISFLQKLVELPKEQEKIYEELIDVLGPDRQPTVDDKPNLPYTNAFIWEVIRTCDFFFLFPGLRCTRETSLRGYRIPKGAVTVMNFWSANHDPDVFDEPDKFNPSRFISTPDKSKPEFPIAFGMGKRACMGEPLIMIETFLFVATIVKNFELKIPPDVKLTNFIESGQLKISAIPRKLQNETSI